MPAPLSLDLRLRIVSAARSMPWQAVAGRFSVGLATVQRLGRERAGEPLAAKPHNGGPDRFVSPEGEALFAGWLADKPSLTQAEFTERFGAATGQPISRRTAGRTLRRMGQTLKKSP